MLYRNPSCFVYYVTEARLALNTEILKHPVLVETDPGISSLPAGFLPAWKSSYSARVRWLQAGPETTDYLDLFPVLKTEAFSKILFKEDFAQQFPHAHSAASTLLTNVLAFNTPIVDLAQRASLEDPGGRQVSIKSEIRDLIEAVEDPDILSVTVDYTEAVAGGVAKLPCDVTPPSSVDRVHLVIWYKESLSSPIYSIDARNLTIEGGRHWSEERALGGRAYFQSTTSPARLTIESVKESDSGMYRCRVDFRKSPTRNTKVNLTVIIPPEKLTVLNERGEDAPQYILGPYNEGATVDITCVSEGGRPLPKVTWWQENTLLDDSCEAISDRQVLNVLRVKQLSRRHLHKVFTCQATNNYLTPLSSAITLDLNLRPLSAKILGENGPLSAGVSFGISCEVIGSRPPPIITWWKGNEQLRNSKEKISTDGNSTTSTLMLVPTVQDSGKRLTCKATNSLIPGSKIEDEWKLDIHHVPQVLLELGRNLKSTVIKEGMDVYFECKIKANPWVSRVTWRHDGNPVVNNPARGIIIANQSLVLQSIGQTRAGKYTCVGSNKEGDGESNFLQLDVMYVPICRPGQDQTIGVGKGELAKITCWIEANPPATEYAWRFNNSGESVEIPGSHYTSQPNLSILTYTPLTEQDFGTVLCWAKNSMGMMKRPCIYHVVSAGKPDSLNNCSLVNQSEVSLGVECNEGFDGGVHQQFVMEVNEMSNMRLTANISSTSPHLTATGLPPGQEFQIVIYAVNAKGRSEYTTINTHTLKYPEKRTAEVPMMPDTVHIIAILSGIVLTLVLVTICSVVAIKFWRRKEPKDHDSAYESKHDSIRRSSESLENNPDIIPNSSEFQDVTIKREGKPPKIHFQDNPSETTMCHKRSDVSYVSVGIGTTGCEYLEVIPPPLIPPSMVLPPIVQQPTGQSPLIQPTVYAQIEGRSHLYVHHTAV